MADPAVLVWLGWFWLIANTFSAVAVVFVNKLVFTAVSFSFPIALSTLHTFAIWLALSGWKAAGNVASFTPASPGISLYLASLHAGYMVLSTLSLALNTVSFYQVCKIASTPVVIFLELVLFQKVPRLMVCLSVSIVCIGIAFATINDPISIQNVAGMVVGIASTVITAMFNIQAGALQRSTGLNSQQLLISYTPYASLVLTIMTFVLEPCGLWPGQGALINKHAATMNLLAYQWSVSAITIIGGSAVIGVAVTLTTFLAIAGTSTLTYSVVGHMKTLLVLLGALVVLGEAMPWKRALGITAAFGGIVWYTLLVTVWKEATPPEATKPSPAGTTLEGAGNADAQGQRMSTQWAAAAQVPGGTKSAWSEDTASMRAPLLQSQR